MRPVIVFAPGAWHPVNTFDSLAALLAADGYESQTIAFPAIHRATEIREPSLALDIAAVRAVIEPLVEAGREVVLVMHSWSGVPGNSALEGLTIGERTALGKAGGVRHLVFMTAFVTRVGQCLLDLSGPLPWLTIDGNAGTSIPKDPVYRFYHDVAEDEAQKWVNALLPHAVATTVAPATATACISTPSTYILCAQDNAIPLALQEKMVATAREDGSKMESVLLDTAHSPWMVQPQSVVKVLRSAAQSQVAAVL